MKVAIDGQAGAQIAGVNAGAGEAIGGYRRAASESRGGVEQNYRKELDANKTVYVSQVDAAGITRDAGNQAAPLRQSRCDYCCGRGGRFRERWGRECAYDSEFCSPPKV